MSMKRAFLNRQVMSAPNEVRIMPSAATCLATDQLK